MSAKTPISVPSVKRITIRNPYNYDTKAASDAAAFRPVGPTLTKLDQQAEADINNIVRAFGLGKPLPYTRTVPTFDDFSGVSDYQTALGLLKEAADSFAALPSAVRDKLGNDPAKLVAIASSPDARAKLEELGLTLPATPVAAPVEASK